MRKKSSAQESQLRKLIREMIREELTAMHRVSPMGEPMWEQAEMEQMAREEMHPPWAVFGSPEPAPQQRQRQGGNAPNWNEPYHPHHDLDAPPYIPPQRPKRR
jgi:hypothetical protein